MFINFFTDDFRIGIVLSLTSVIGFLLNSFVPVFSPFWGFKVLSIIGLTMALPGVLAVDLFKLGGKHAIYATYFGIPIAITGLMVGKHVADRGRIIIKDTLSWSWKSALFGLGLGIFTGIMLPLNIELVYRAYIGLLIGGISIFSLGVNRNELVNTRTKPNQGIKRSIKNSISSGSMITSVIMTISFLGYFLGDYFIKSMALKFAGISLLIGLSFGYYAGGTSCIQHFILRFMLSYRNLIPWNLVRFLDYAADRILLRKVGGGYIFIHRMLLEHFASLYEKELEYEQGRFLEPSKKAHTNSIPESEKIDNKLTFGNITGGIHDSSIAGRDVIQNITIISTPDLSALFTSEYQSQLEHALDLLNDFRAQETIVYLEKLKNRIWDTAQPIIKYGILRNLGAAKILQGQPQEAAKHFIGALQYHPNDEKALCNVALGYLLLELFEEANSFAKKALDKNPANCHAYSLLLQSFPNTQDFEDLVTMVPEPFRMTPEVGLALGIIARKRKQPVEAKRWLEIAIQHDTKDQPEPRGELGGVLLELVISSEHCLNGLQLTDEQKSQIQQAIELFDFALSRTSHAAHWDFRSGWLANRGLAKRFAGDLEGAIQDTEQYLEIHPSSPNFTRRLALLAYESGDVEKAVTLLKSILAVEEPPDIPIVLALVLRSSQRASESVEILQEFLSGQPDGLLQEKAQRELISSYLALGDFENATNISEMMRVTKPADVLNFVDAAEIAFASGNHEESFSCLLEARQFLSSTSPIQHQVELANGFYALKEFEEAARIYEYFVDPSLNTPLTFRLLMSYYQSGEKGKALEICQTLRQKYGILEHVTDMEASIYEEIGDLAKAKKTAQEYLELFPEHFGMKLLIAVVNSRTGELEELDLFLSSASYADVEALPWEFGVRLAYLYIKRNIHRQAIEILYELRRKFPEQGIVHLKYIQAFVFLKESTVLDWLLPTKVGVGTAVRLQKISGELEWNFIVDHQDADPLRKRFSSEHHIAQKLLDREAGDDVVLKESDYSKESAKITEIKSKYIYALHESLETFEMLFPEVSGLWVIDGSDEEKTEKVLRAVADHHETYLDIEQWYHEGILSLGAFAGLIGRNVIGVWANLTTKPDIGIKCCYGSHEERDFALSLLNDTPTLIVDMIALLTLDHLQAGDVVVNTYGKLGVAQSTVDLLQHAIGMRSGRESEGFSTLGKEGEQFVLEKVSPELVQQGVEYFERLRDWVENNCEVLPCHPALHIKWARKKELEEILGKAFLDTILLASESGRLLYSDDGRLRALAKHEHNIDGVWTQVLLLHCLQNSLLEKERYHEMVIKLATAHYYHTSIDAEVLLEAARRADWSPSEPYTTLVQVLQGGASDEDSALNVGTNFLYELSKQPVWHQPVYRDAFIQSVLQVVTKGRHPRRILHKLEVWVKKQFVLSPVTGGEIFSLIELWKQTHII